MIVQNSDAKLATGKASAIIQTLIKALMAQKEKVVITLVRSPVDKRPAGGTDNRIAVDDFATGTVDLDDLEDFPTHAQRTDPMDPTPIWAVDRCQNIAHILGEYKREAHYKNGYDDAHNPPPPTARKPGGDPRFGGGIPSENAYRTEQGLAPIADSVPVNGNGRVAGKDGRYGKFRNGAGAVGGGTWELLECDSNWNNCVPRYSAKGAGAGGPIADSGGNMIARADPVFIGRVVAVSEEAGAPSGVLKTWQVVTYDVVQVLMGSLLETRLEVRHVLVGDRALSSSLFSPGNILTVRAMPMLDQETGQVVYEGGIEQGPVLSDWAPLGPMIARLVIKTYPDRDSELAALANTEIDIADQALDQRWLETFLQPIFQGKIDLAWSFRGTMAYRSGWQGVVNDPSLGIDGPLTFLGAYHKATNELRYGMVWSRQDAPFELGARFPLWSINGRDWALTEMMYDTLMQTAPTGEAYASMATTGFCPGGGMSIPCLVNNPTSAQLGYTDIPQGTVQTQRWFVKQHLGWHSGKPVTGKDVVFSLLAMVDLHKTDGPDFFNPINELLAVRLVSDVPQQIVVDVHLNTISADSLKQIERLPIFPCNTYDTDNCSEIQLGVTLPTTPFAGYVDGPVLSQTFDPVFVADGPDADTIPESDCASTGHRTGHVGSGAFILECTSNGTAFPGIGGTMIFRSFTTTKSQFTKSGEYWASPHNYLVWRWADFDNDGVVGSNDKARTRLSPPLGCRNKPVPTDQNLWDQNNDGMPDDICTQFDYNRNGVSSDFADRARITLEGGKRWTAPNTWPYPASAQGVSYPWPSWIWWLTRQCSGPDNTKGTLDDDKNACWFTKFASRPP